MYAVLMLASVSHLSADLATNSVAKYEVKRMPVSDTKGVLQVLRAAIHQRRTTGMGGRVVNQD